MISFFTVGTSYEDEIKTLKQSLDKYGIKHDIRYINSLGGWQANTIYKAEFIRSMLFVMEETGEKAMVWLDADSVVSRYPGMFDHIDTDVAFYFRTSGPVAQRMGGYELISAAMYFKINHRVKALLDMWIANNERNQLVLDQRNLQAIIPEWRERFAGTVTYLPQSYCRIFDAPEDPRVIIQNQASRRFKKEVGE